MNRDWIENLESHLPPNIDHAIHEVDHAIRDFALRIRFSRWNLISTVPCNRVVELRINEGGEILALEFPCLQTNAGDWIDVDLGTRIELHPVEWRIWQHSKSPQPHYSPVTLNDRLALLHHALWRAKRQTSIDINNFVIQKTDAVN